jgi:hypothetical protein
MQEKKIRKMENERRENFFHSGMNQIAYTKKAARILTTNDCHL